MPKTEELILRRKDAGLLSRIGDELRSITLGPYSTKDKTLARIFGGSGSAGVRVNEESSLSYAAVWNAVTLIAGDVAKVPLCLYRRLGENGKEQFRSNPLYELVHDQPNEQMSSFQFRRTLQGHVLLWGNAFAEIVRNGGNQATALWPLMPWAVETIPDGRDFYYRVWNPDGRPVDFDRMNILHLSGFGSDGINGYQPIRKAMESIGIGIATQRYVSKFFENGAHMNVVVSYPPGVGGNPQTRKENREALESRHAGVDNSHRILSLYEGAEVFDLGTDPEKSQLTPTRRFNIEEVSRWFNIPVHKLKELERATFSNIEQQEIDYDKTTLQPWFRMWEGELGLKLIPRLERKIQFFEHITEALTRGDSAAQGELISKQFSVGGITPNEIRGKYNMNPVAGGDVVWVPANMYPLDLAIERAKADIDQMKAKAEADRRPPPMPQPPPPPPSNTDQTNALTLALDTARQLTQAAEDLREKAEADLITEKTAHTDTATRLTQANEALEQATRLRRESDERAEHWHDRTKKWREWAQLVFLGGGPVVFEDDDPLRGAVCAASDSEIEERVGREKAAHEQTRTELTREIETHKGAAEVQSKVSADTAEALRQAEAARDAALKGEIEAIEKGNVLERQRLDAEAEAARLKAAHAAELEPLIARSEKDVGHINRLCAELATAEKERDAAKVKLEELQGEQAKLENINSLLDDNVLKAEAQRDAAAAELETVKTDLARARADIAAELDKQKTQKAVMLAALRSLWVDATERLLYREAERARKNQQTPDKLREWAARFYEIHEQYVRQTFQPLVGPWTAITGGAPSVLLDRLVADHLTASRQSLGLVLEYDDPDEFAAHLERTLSRWESERAESMADALVREGMAS